MGLTIGRHSYNHPVLKGDMNNVIIGNYCSIAANVIMDCGWNHNIENISTFPFHSLNGECPNNNVCSGDIVIGSDVWIGMDSIIFSGVNIGHGAVIGARSIITKDVPPYAVVVGSNRIAKYRFIPRDRVFLSLLKWWDMPHDEVMRIAPILLSGDVSKLREMFPI